MTYFSRCRVFEKGQRRIFFALKPPSVYIECKKKNCTKVHCLARALGATFVFRKVLTEKLLPCAPPPAIRRHFSGNWRALNNGIIYIYIYIRRCRRKDSHEKSVRRRRRRTAFRFQVRRHLYHSLLTTPNAPIANQLWLSVNAKYVNFTHRSTPAIRHRIFSKVDFNDFNARVLFRVGVCGASKHVNCNDLNRKTCAYTPKTKEQNRPIIHEHNVTFNKMEP